MTARAATVFCALFIAGCAAPIEQPGWSCDEGGGGVMCHPADGRLLGFRVGMSKAEALAAGCEALLMGQIKESSTYFTKIDGRCVIEKRVADMSGKWAVWDGWSFKPARMRRHCYGPEGETMFVDFDRASGKVKAVGAYCSVTMP